MSNELYDSLSQEFIEGKAAFLKDHPDFAREYISSKLTETSGKTLIDIGCGSGEDIAHYETLGFSSVYGVDPSEKMIEEAKKVVAHPDNVWVGDYEQTGLPDASVDYVVARYSLHYLISFDKAYEEIARILKPGGKLVEMVDHPIADYVEGEHIQKDGIPYQRIKLYYGAVTVEFPRHNFADYFSPTFFRLFTLEDFVEHTGLDREFTDGPNAFGYTANKR
jgi:ubiquinone/menaquinone biosynthesis C-methylase UbiE